MTVAEGARFEMHNLQVDEGGTIEVLENGFINTYDEIRLNGTILLGENTDSHFPSLGMDEKAMANVHFDGEYSEATIHCPVKDDAELRSAVSQAMQL